jgi:cell division protein ZipA
MASFQGGIEMDISSFRWVLIVVGIAIVAGIFLFGNPDRKRKPRASRKRVHAQRVLDAPLKLGRVFGAHDIFHRIHEEDVEPIFSMANLTKPGSFDKNAWNTMEIRGVTMFMTLPGPRNALDAWDSMLATSRRLAEVLHADLLDEKREVFTRQRSLQIKEELREYERQKNADS